MFSLFAAIVSAFHRVENFFSQGVYPNFVKPAYEVVKVLQQVISEPDLDFFTALTGITVPENLVEKVLEALPEILANLGMTKNALKESDPVLQVKVFTNYIAKLPEPIRDAALAKFASLLAVHLSDGQLKSWMADVLLHIHHASNKISAQA
jgi:hypothetical protein